MLDTNFIPIVIEMQCRPKVLTRWTWVNLTLQTINLYVPAERQALERELFWGDYTESATVGDLAVIRACRLTIKTIYDLYYNGGD